jgi:hypothetical protein
MATRMATRMAGTRMGCEGCFRSLDLAQRSDGQGVAVCPVPMLCNFLHRARCRTLHGAGRSTRMTAAALDLAQRWLHQRIT